MTSISSKRFFYNWTAAFLLLLIGLPYAFLLNASISLLQAPAQKLEITDVLFQDFQGRWQSDFSMDAGGEVSMTFRIAGFRRERGESQSGLWEWEEQVHLQYNIELRDPSGVLLEPPKTDEINVRLGPRDEKWQPKINWSAKVPPSAPGGNYQIQIRVKDLLNNQEVSRNISFPVMGQPVNAAIALEIQQLEFATSATGPWFSRRVYSISETVHVRYKVVGFQISAAKEVWVEQDWSIIDPQGNIVVSRTDASVDKSQSNYPPRFLPTSFDMKLQDAVPGEYTLRIQLRDRIGITESSLETNFAMRP